LNVRRAQCFAVVVAVFCTAAVAAEPRISDSEIRQRMVRESVASFLGTSCPCPYSVARDGKLCRDDSAYARGRGGKLYCYEHDISEAMIKQYRAQRGLN